MSQVNIDSSPDAANCHEAFTKHAGKVLRSAPATSRLRRCDPPRPLRVSGAAIRPGHFASRVDRGREPTAGRSRHFIMSMLETEDAKTMGIWFTEGGSSSSGTATQLDVSVLILDDHVREWFEDQQSSTVSTCGCVR